MISVGLGSLAAQHHSRKRVVFVVYGKKLIHSLTPPFIFNQHNAQNGQKTPAIPGSEAGGSTIRCAATATRDQFPTDS